MDIKIYPISGIPSYTHSKNSKKQDLNPRKKINNPNIDEKTSFHDILKEEINDDDSGYSSNIIKKNNDKER